MKKARLLLLLVPAVAGVFYLRSLISWRPKKVFQTQEHDSQREIPVRMVFSSDGNTLLVGSTPDPNGVLSGELLVTTLTALDVRHGFQPLWQRGFSAPFASFQFFGHDSQILKCGDDVQILDARTGKTRTTYAGLKPPVAISPDGGWLAYKRTSPSTGRDVGDGRIYLGQVVATSPRRNPRADKVIGKPGEVADAFAFSPDGQTLAVGVGDRSGAHLDFYDTRTWHRTLSYSDWKSQFPGHEQPPSYSVIKWSGDGQLLYSSWTHIHRGRGRRIWRLSDGQKFVVDSRTGSLSPLGSSLPPMQDEGSILTYGDYGRTVRRHVPTLGTVTEILRLSKGQLESATLSPDGSTLIAGTYDGDLFSQRLK